MFHQQTEKSKVLGLNEFKFKEKNTGVQLMLMNAECFLSIILYHQIVTTERIWSAFYETILQMLKFGREDLRTNRGTMQN